MHNTAIKKRKLIYGWGVNDSDYVINPTTNGKQIVCKFYSTWRHMVARCYSSHVQNTHPTYNGCTVCDEWKSFMTFKSWMEKQEWEGMQLDKDILFYRNKHYSPKTCVFVDAKTNTLLIDSGASRGKYPLGVNFDKNSGKFSSMCGDGNGNSKYLGLFDSPDGARKEYLKFKMKVIKTVALRQPDSRVKDALMLRLAPMREEILC